MSSTQQKDDYLRANHPDEVERQRRTFLRMEHSHNQFFNFLESVIGQHSGMRVIDMACGCGLMANEIYLRWGCHVEGWDINNKYLEAAKTLFPNVHFQKIGFMDLIPESLNYDLVLFREALMVCRQPIAVIEWSRGLLKQEGWIAALEPDYGATIIYPEIPGWNDFFEKYKRYCENKGGENFLMGRALLKHFRKTGLRNIHIQPIVEVHSCLDKEKLRNFMEIEAFSIETDMDGFVKETGFPIKRVSDIVQNMRTLFEHNSAYVQTLMVAICGQN